MRGRRAIEEEMIMTRKLKYALIVLPATLALSACGNPQEKQAEAVQEKTLDQPGFEGKSATPTQAQSEALSLAQHLSSDTLEAGEAAIVLEDLDRLVTDNLTDFPEDMRPALTEDIQSAKDALEAEDMAGMQEAAKQFHDKLAGSVATSDAK
jgi:hypothetical protein